MIELGTTSTSTISAHCTMPEAPIVQSESVQYSAGVSTSISSLKVLNLILLESLKSRSFLSIPGKEFLDFRESRLATVRQ